MYHSSACCAIVNPFLTNVVSRLLWIAQSVPLSTGWQTSEVLRIIFAIAIQLLQLKQTWWFPAHCSHIFSPVSVCQSSSKWVSFLGQDLARWRSSFQTLTWAWQIHHLGRAKTSSSSIWDLSAVSSSGTPGISGVQLIKTRHASQPDIRWCLERFIAASGQEEEGDHSTRSSTCHGGICAPAAWDSLCCHLEKCQQQIQWQLGGPRLCGTQQNHSYIRHTLKQLI